MHIGGNDNFLMIECLSVTSGICAWRVEAVSQFGDIRFSVTHGSVYCNSSSDDLEQLDEFASLRRNFLELQLAGGGWLRSERDARGWITVRYRIAGWKSPEALEGEATVEGEFTSDYYLQLKALLQH